MLPTMIITLKIKNGRKVFFYLLEIVLNNFFYCIINKLNFHEEIR